MDKEEIKKYLKENMTIESTVCFDGEIEIKIEIDGEEICKTQFEPESE